MVANKVARTRERGEARKHLVINSALLSLIDPVRGKPTKGLIEGYPDDDVLRRHQLKEKFLDSFALICSTSSSGKETASAVCMEQTQQSETILRVARNRGVSQQDLTRLKRVLQVLAATANGEKLSMQAETEVLKEVVDLDKNRILSLVGKLDKGGIRRVFQLAISKLSLSVSNEEKILGEPGFGYWIKTCPFTATPIDSSGTSYLISLVKWASQARWVYPKHLQVLLAFGPMTTPPWVENLYKLARYFGAIKSMVKFAMKQPHIFASIHIQDVAAPVPETFSLQEKALLRKALKRLVKNDCDTTMDKLGQRWETDDVEAKFRRACRLTLTLHAEMQLLDFYERNPSLVPQLRLMGTSKKACFLCYEFLLQHPLRIRVLACHQKVYPTWMPPSSHDIPGVARNKLLWNFSKRIEQVTVKELSTGLAASQRPRNKDSTAGPSLTVTATFPTENSVRHIEL